MLSVFTDYTVAFLYGDIGVFFSFRGCICAACLGYWGVIS